MSGESKRTAYGFIREPSGDLYRRVLQAGLVEGDVLGLVHQRLRDGEYQEPLEELTPWLIDEVEVSEWPGTRRMTEVSLLRRYRFEPPVVETLSDAAESLFDWLSPSLPEDVHLLRGDGSVWLGSIAHERDAWLELSDEDLGWLRREYPKVAGAIAPEAWKRQ